ncbi:MAG: hypothetical protein D084_Lepto4C00499G0001 [Leptospirillum sp. Group IV 'UBA BS']|nr:MAG: hypothetical protein D084_Lepto4C00499G0001 [Leptospirillum sp. Group IV 'UBA BS']
MKAMGLFLVIGILLALRPPVAQSATGPDNLPASPTKSAPSGPPRAPGPSPSSKSPAPPVHGEKAHPLSLNGPDALAAYRKSWNPLTSGPDLMPQADTLPEGEFNVRFFMYGRFTQAQYSDSGGITGLPPGYSQTQLLDLFAMFYGLDTNTELVFLPSVITTFSTQNGTSLNGSGLNDLSFGIKHRWIIQDPSTGRAKLHHRLSREPPDHLLAGDPGSSGGASPHQCRPLHPFRHPPPSPESPCSGKI